MTLALRRQAARLALALLPSFALAAPPMQAPIVIAQSLGMSNESDAAAWRIADAAKALVAHVNAQGGLHGRAIQLLTLDDGGDPQRHAANLRQAVQVHGAVALLNCAGDAVCTADAALSDELHVPLVGPISGVRRLTLSKGGYSFPLRPGYDREAAALVRQLAAMAVLRLAVLADSNAQASEALDTLRQQARAAGLRLTVQPVDATRPATVETALKQAAEQHDQAALLMLSPEQVSALLEGEIGRRPEWPGMIVSLANGALASLMRAFPGHLIGFTSVVPDPESQTLPLASQLREQITRHGSNGVAVSFEGLEAYLNTKVCLEAIRRAGPVADAERVASALRAMDRYDAGGLVVSFTGGRATGSDFMAVGMRSRHGRFVK
jgi:ABC-type branched-subunit amino acid transport system substrate-binding protein